MSQRSGCASRWCQPSLAARRPTPWMWWTQPGSPREEYSLRVWALWQDAQHHATCTYDNHTNQYDGPDQPIFYNVADCFGGRVLPVWSIGLSDLSNEYDCQRDTLQRKTASYRRALEHFIIRVFLSYCKTWIACESDSLTEKSLDWIWYRHRY